MDVILFVVPMVFAIAAGFSFLFWKLLAGRGWNDADGTWFREFSVDEYRPMERLLSEADYQFLAGQPGYQASIAKNLRAERKAICRAYLRQLTSDFHKLLGVARLLMVESVYDRADLEDAISRVRYRFYWNLFLVEASLSFPALVRGGARVGNLVQSLEMVHESLVKTQAA